MLWAMNLHVFHRRSLQLVTSGGEEGEVLGILTYEGIANVARAAVGKKVRIFKGVFAAIRGGKNRIIFLMILLKLGRLGL